MSDPVLFLVAVVTILAAPGPTNALLALSGASVGIVRSMGSLAAALAAYLIAIVASHVLVAGLVEAYPSLGVALKVGVAAYLIWLAIKLWRQPLRLDAGGTVTVANVFVTTLLNPKALIFALTIIPWSAAELPWYFVAFAATVVAAGSSWIVLGSVIKGASGTKAGYIPKVASVVLVGFAGLILRAAF